MQNVPMAEKEDPTNTSESREVSLNPMFSKGLTLIIRSGRTISFQGHRHLKPMILGKLSSPLRIDAALGVACADAKRLGVL